MKAFWVLILVFIPLMGLGYCLYRTWHILPLPLFWKRVVIGVMIFCFSWFFLNFFIADKLPFPLACVTYEVGNSSLFIMMYLVILYGLLDLARITGVLPGSFMYGSLRGTVSVLVIMVGVFTYGYFHYLDKTRQTLELTTEKPLGRPMTIVMISDLHLGYHNRIGEFRKWVDMINKENPDLILIGGDILDGSIRAVRHQNMAEEFRRLKAPVYACLGNHEYISGVEEARKFYRDAGINLLVDTVAVYRDINIIGRDDRSAITRNSLAVVDAHVKDRNKYSILLDHQPYNLEKAEEQGIDFQFSGHTHYGQMWPISWVEDMMYEDAWGPLVKGHTLYYVTSGIGQWGAKFRVGTRSEYLVAHLVHK